MLKLPDAEMFTYWGMWYYPNAQNTFDIKVLADSQPFNPVEGITRDLFHYQFALQMNPRPEAIVVADTGFQRQVRAEYRPPPIPVVCAETASKAIYE